MPDESSEPEKADPKSQSDSGRSRRVRAAITIIAPVATGALLLTAAPVWWHPLIRFIDGTSVRGPSSAGPFPRAPASEDALSSPAGSRRPHASASAVAPPARASSPIYHAPPSASPPTITVTASTTSAPVPTSGSPKPRSISRTVLVYATTAAGPLGGGQSTGVRLSRGQKVDLRATGQIIYGYEGANCVGYPRTDPDGNRISSVTGQPCGRKIDTNPAMPSSDLPVGSLLWRVGESGWFEAGKSAIIIAPDPGQLFLCVNDDTIQDNSRFFTVRLTRRL